MIPEELQDNDIRKRYSIEKFEDLIQKYEKLEREFAEFRRKVDA